MLQTINDKLKPLLGGVKLDPRLGLGLMAGLAGLLALAVVFYLWRDQGAMRSLYGAGEAYTRHGSLQVDADMQLTINGRAVLGEGGPIVLPQFDSIRIANDGRISVLPRGEPQMVEVDQIKLVDVPAAQLSKDNAGLLVTRDGMPAATDESVQLASGFLEASNVSAIDELVGTMSLSRLFETQVKMMKAAEDLSTAGNSLIRAN